MKESKKKLKIFLGSDHAGFELKKEIKKYLLKRRLWLLANKFNVVDCGCFNRKSVDYPDVAFEVSKQVALNEGVFGILICGTGIGMSIAANKIDGIRAALCTTEFMAERARRHNNANILCLSGFKDEATETEIKTALIIVSTFLRTPFSQEERHVKRIRLIQEKSLVVNQKIENEKLKCAKGECSS